MGYHRKMRPQVANDVGFPGRNDRLSGGNGLILMVWAEPHPGATSFLCLFVPGVRVSCAPFEPVAVMKSSEYRCRYEFRVFREAMPVFLQRYRGVLIRVGETGSERGMRPLVIVVINILAKDASEMVLRKGNHVIQTIPAECSDYTFAEGIGLWSFPRCCARFRRRDVVTARASGRNNRPGIAPNCCSDSRRGKGRIVRL
jgi:hypothetical protein